MMRLVRWLHARLGAWLARRAEIPAFLEQPFPALGADVPAPDPDPAARVADLPAFPVTPNGERFVVWSRGTVQIVTDNEREAAKSFARATQRAGVHRFWDRQHHTSVPRGLRTEVIIPLEGT
jgi:hypothetical protein